MPNKSKYEDQQNCHAAMDKFSGPCGTDGWCPVTPGARCGTDPAAQWKGDMAWPPGLTVWGLGIWQQVGGGFPHLSAALNSSPHPSCCVGFENSIDF